MGERHGPSEPGREDSGHHGCGSLGPLPACSTHTHTHRHTHTRTARVRPQHHELLEP